jgi:hypothetical protein
MARFQFLALSHPRHSGRYLPHRHTSWAALTFILLVSGMLLGALSLNGALPLRAASGDLAVTAIVPGAPPSSAPTLTGVEMDSHVANPEVTLSGTCQSGLTVVITSNAVRKGTAICDNTGHYQLLITLVSGRNELVAIQYDTLDQPSPASQPLVVYYDPPAPISTGSGVVTGGKSHNVTTHGGGATATPLYHPPIISTSNHFQGVTAGSPFRLTGSVRDGVAPYALSIDWGDGYSSLVSLVGDGRFEASHTYDAGGDYAVVLRITDINGASSTYQTVVSVIGAPAAHQPQLVGGRLMIAWPIYIAIVMLTLGFWLGDLYERQRPKADPKTHSYI